MAELVVRSVVASIRHCRPSYGCEAIAQPRRCFRTGHTQPKRRSLPSLPIPKDGFGRTDRTQRMNRTARAGRLVSLGIKQEQ
jgi:hypothetical protein